MMSEGESLLCQEVMNEEPEDDLGLDSGGGGDTTEGIRSIQVKNGGKSPN